LEGLGLRWSREGAGGIQIYQARDPWQAGRAAEALARIQGVDVSVAVMRRGLAMHGRYASRPDDPFFPDQWHLENRDAAGRPVGVDLNVRAGWAVAEGAGVTVAICDDGFEVDHPDLRDSVVPTLHWDFITGRSGSVTYGSHSTCVAGLVAAANANGIGVSGVAPKARLGSWAIFDALGDIASDEALMDMFQSRIDEVAVQNHSWGNASAVVLGPSELEKAAIANAVEKGREGRGVVIVRSGGNQRYDPGGFGQGAVYSANVNDDGYANDPRVIAVAAIRKDGRTANYSSAGACLLVGAPSGDEDDISEPTEGVTTTDRVGRRGYNRTTGLHSQEDYALHANGFSGTSASAPQISGIVALVLSANPRLTVRDVQQVLIHASRQPDASDPDRKTNGAGYGVSHNTGFGIPDAGQAVKLAEAWKLRPAPVTLTMRHEETLAIPDAGLRVWLSRGDGTERSVVCEGAPGPHPDAPTERLPLVHVGLASSPIAENLAGKAALIQRGGSTFREKLTYVARAGARFAIFYNNTGRTTLDFPGYTDFVGIPAVFIPQDEGESLAARVDAGEVVEAQLRVESVARTFEVTRALVCEHVGLRVRSNHPRRGDVRIVVVSPSGMRSVMQNRNFDEEPGPVDWTYWSTQHFYESSLGNWRVEISDQSESFEGEILEMELTVLGIEIEDSDADGLDDRWERRWLGDLKSGAMDDGDQDGSPNTREQVLGTDPRQADEAFRLTMVPFDRGAFRLSWPATSDKSYRVRRRSLTNSSENVETEMVGRFPEMEWVVPSNLEPGAVFQIEAVPR